MKDTGKSSENNFEATNLLLLIIKRRVPLLIITLIAVFVSAGISLMITPKFKSSVILFPASSTSVSQSLLSETYNEKELLKFGEEEEVEQMMQVLKSSEIRDRIIKKYRLLEHYDIDKDSKYPITNLYREFESNIKISRTEFMSVKIEVLDRSADTAAKIANDIAALLDSVMNNMQIERAQKAYLLVKNEYAEQNAFVQRLKDSINFLHNKGVIVFEVQSEMYHEQYATALAEGNFRGAKALEKKLDTLAKYGGTYQALVNQLEEEIKKLAKLETRYTEASVDVKQDLPHKFIVDRGEKAEKKSYPIRWLIVVVSTLSAFLLALILLIIIERLKKN